MGGVHSFLLDESYPVGVSPESPGRVAVLHCQNCWTFGRFATKQISTKL